MNRTDGRTDAETERVYLARTRGETPSLYLSRPSGVPRPLSWWQFALLCLAPFVPPLLGLLIALP